jgi:haloacetate dehalogenase
MSGPFDGFEEFDLTTSVTTIHGRLGGDGPPILLLHGIPETHLMWHRIAPRLAERHTVVATDLRGFGNSGTPPSAPDHAVYSMRAIAGEQVEVMAALGHDRFAVVGHDRGARCAYRMALDHPLVVTSLTALDIVPTADVFRRAEGDLMMSLWVWTFLAAPEPIPERLIAGTPEVIVDHMLDAWSDTPDAFPQDVRAAYVSAFRNPETIHAICEEYRAAATLDRQHDDEDRGRRRISCPVLVLWSDTGWIAGWDPLTMWRTWADDVRGGPISAGHFLPEEAPDATVREILEFLGT